MKLWRIVCVVAIALAGGLLPGRAPVSAGTIVQNPLDLIDELLINFGLMVSVFEDDLGEWSEWISVLTVEDLNQLESVEPSAVMLGFGNPEFADIFPWVDCVNLSTPDGGPFQFDFVLDYSDLAFDPENCEPLVLPPAAAEVSDPLPIGIFLWFAIGENSGWRTFNCLDLAGRVTTEGVIDGEMIFPQVGGTSVNSESLLASVEDSPTIAGVISAATSSRARLRDTPLVAFLLGVDSMGPGDGYEPAEGDGVWDLAVSISECSSRSSVDLDHYLDRAEATALPDTL